MRDLGWDAIDVLLVTGDAHVDHPSFPASLIGRVLEAEGVRVGVVSRPDPRDPTDIARLGMPRLFAGVTAGALDSMVGNYTALKRRRSDDPYAPGGKAGGRPDRALTAYCNLVRRAFGKRTLVIAGGLEASLRRFAHYDYWSDSIRRPILMDCGADIAVHGMGEGPVVEIARRLQTLRDDATRGEKTGAIRGVPGVVYRVPRSVAVPDDGVALPGVEDVAGDPVAYARSHAIQEKHRGSRVWQDCSGMRVIANPPWPPLTGEEIDRISALPFTRDPHPSYGRTRVPALEQVRFAVTTHRGCAGGCAFCAIGAHQGRDVSSRSAESVLDEVRRIAAHRDFKGTVTDLGGPTANMFSLTCSKDGPCERPSCLWPKRCRHLCADQQPYLDLLTRAAKVPGVKHLFVTTGIRTDLAVTSEALVRALAGKHTSGLMKVAPEHVSKDVLRAMRKPAADGFVEFLARFREFSKEAGREQYVLPYAMAAHPGCRMEDMEELRRFLKKHDLKAEQCQIFTPTPGTAATVMYATGLDPLTGNPVFVERDPKRKQQQKEMILHHVSPTRSRSKETDNPLKQDGKKGKYNRRTNKRSI